ncbi:acetylxylan esterase [Occultella aeris]|uniref:Cephalosporin-C deacetylase n=1 Tax=Occultella aeris TaxID=2761496 RepID=A0A7M4DGK6_9MICO|nr:acetylxylan esterase [Occultella aeris]VZO36049.1 Cephalosporin-C deacetylase [Occultella aeris]
MVQFDLPLAQLREYTADLVAPADLLEFWQETLAEGTAMLVSSPRFATPWRLIDTYDVTFRGYAGSPVRAWLSVPAGNRTRLPTVVQYQGYSGGRSFPESANVWASAGYAHVVMDTRGQGYANGAPAQATPDPLLGSGHAPGFLTAGVESPAEYYYRRVYTDAVRLVQALGDSPHVDPDRIAVTGRSQGGGVALAVAGLAHLVGLRLSAVLADVPFLCAFPRANQVTDAEPYREIDRYLAGWRDRTEVVFRTLSYFDAALLAATARADALFSVGLVDRVTPPSTVFAAFNRYGLAAEEVTKEIRVYSHNGHEGGGQYQVHEQAAFLAARLRGVQE